MAPHSPSNSPSGFSLVELSIVLVILGLLTGGILSGQSLIRSAELRAITTEYQRYAAAVMSFRDRYMALPGDAPNATRFWGIAAGSTGYDTACFESATSDSTTCNGNGDGTIGQYYNLNLSLMSERYLAWKHLANAGLVEGTYRGSLPPSGGNQGEYLKVPGAVPTSKLANAVWLLHGRPASGNNTDSAWEFNFIRYGGNILTIGEPHSSNYGVPTGAVVRPAEAWNIDAKIDDGDAIRGRMWVSYRSGCTTAASNSDQSAAYLLSNSSLSCSMMFQSGK